jgi:hypothetical protein
MCTLLPHVKLQPQQIFNLSLNVYSTIRQLHHNEINGTLNYEFCLNLEKGHEQDQVTQVPTSNMRVQYLDPRIFGRLYVMKSVFAICIVIPRYACPVCHMRKLHHASSALACI